MLYEKGYIFKFFNISLNCLEIHVPLTKTNFENLLKMYHQEIS
jgi:hypothetical protein